MGSGRESVVDRAGPDIPPTAEGVKVFTEDDESIHTVYSLRGGDVALYAGERQVERGSSPEVDSVEVRFRESKDDQGRRGAVLVRTRGDRKRGGETVELLQEMYRIHEGRSDLPLMAYRSYGGWKVWTRGQATYCLRRGLTVVAEVWEKGREGEKAPLVLEEFSATRLAAMVASPQVIQREGR